MLPQTLYRSRRRIPKGIAHHRSHMLTDEREGCDHCRREAIGGQWLWHEGIDRRRERLV